MSLFRILLWAQSLYVLVTALWPLIDIQSFQEVTGYKTDLWLVKTVGALLIPIAITLGSFLFVKGNPWQAIGLGALTAVAFISIDFYYALNDVISDIYIADGAVEGIFLIGWVVIFLKTRRNAYSKTT